MSRLTHDQGRDLGAAAIRRAIGDMFTEVSAEIGPDFEGKDAYHFTTVFHTDSDWRRASSLLAEMTRAVIDDLDGRKDERLPSIRTGPGGTWTFPLAAAAE